MSFKYNLLVFMKKALFPLDAKLNRVLGMLSLLIKSKGKLRLSELARLSRSQVDKLLPEVNAGKMLGLVKVSGVYILLTTLGKQLHEKDPEAKIKVRDKLRRIEPFMSAYALSMKRDEVLAEDIARVIANKGEYLNTDVRKSKTVIDSALMQWAITFGIVSYNGKEKVWLRAG